MKHPQKEMLRFSLSTLERLVSSKHTYIIKNEWREMMRTRSFRAPDDISEVVVVFIKIAIFTDSTSCGSLFLRTLFAAAVLGFLKVN